MFSLFKSKPKLSELIPNTYVDIHSHVLPGIDDGAKSLEETKYLTSEMKQLGFAKIITTPHTMANIWDNTPETITMALNEVNAALTLPFALKAASEYALDESVIQKAYNKTLLTLKENYVLVELSYLNAPLQLYDFLYELQLAGYQVVLAHPERYAYYHNNKKEYLKLKKSGCYFQLNLLATVGYYGKEVANTAHYLIKENLYDFTGSDIHHKHHIKAFQNKLTHNDGERITALMLNNILFK